MVFLGMKQIINNDLLSSSGNSPQHPQLFVSNSRLLYTSCCISRLCSPVLSQAVALMEEFRGLDRDVEGSAKQWRKWAESECPEKERLPQEWKKRSLIQKLIILRAVRPDRMTYALRWGQLALTEINVEEILS